MRCDFPMNQGDWLADNNIGPEIEGFCHVMTTDWVMMRVQARSWNLESLIRPDGTWRLGEGFRAVSHQRGFNLGATSLPETHGGPAASMALGRPYAIDYVADSARSRGLVSQVVWRTIANMTVYRNIQYLEPGCGLVIMVETAEGGHSVGVARKPDGTRLFLDVNTGEYSWTASETGMSMSMDIKDYVTSFPPIQQMDGCWVGPASQRDSILY